MILIPRQLAADAADYLDSYARMLIQTAGKLVMDAKPGDAETVMSGANRAIYLAEAMRIAMEQKQQPSPGPAPEKEPS
jgi:hypothetical protein